MGEKKMDLRNQIKKLELVGIAASSGKRAVFFRSFGLWETLFLQAVKLGRIKVKDPKHPWDAKRRTPERFGPDSVMHNAKGFYAADIDRKKIKSRVVTLRASSTSSIDESSRVVKVRIKVPYRITILAGEMGVRGGDLAILRSALTKRGAGGIAEDIGFWSLFEMEALHTLENSAEEIFGPLKISFKKKTEVYKEEPPKNIKSSGDMFLLEGGYFEIGLEISFGVRGWSNLISA